MLPLSSPTADKPPYRILLVDDHPVTRRGMKALIETQPDFVVCAEAENATSALALLGNVRPHVAIVDISLQGENGLDLVSEFQRGDPKIPVLVVSMHDEEFYATRAQRAGAVGYVMKQHASERILGALRRILAGQTAFGDGVLALAKPNPLLKKNSGGGVESLSERETEVLRLIGDGYATREIAAKLGLSAKTIDTYREHLKLKLNLPNGERLIRFAVQWANSTARQSKESAR